MSIIKYARWGDVEQKNWDNLILLKCEELRNITFYISFIKVKFIVLKENYRAIHSIKKDRYSAIDEKYSLKNVIINYKTKINNYNYRFRELVM